MRMHTGRTAVTTYLHQRLTGDRQASPGWKKGLVGMGLQQGCLPVPPFEPPHLCGYGAQG